MAPPLSVATATATTGGTSAAATSAARPPRLIAVHAGAGLHGVREGTFPAARSRRPAVRLCTKRVVSRRPPACTRRRRRYRRGTATGQ